MTTGASVAPAWSRATGVLERATDRSMLILVDSGEPLRLEGAAMIVWEELRVPLTDEQLITAIAGRFALADDEVRADVIAARETLGKWAAVVVNQSS